MDGTRLFMGATSEEVAGLRSLIKWYDSPGWLRRRTDDRLLSALSLYEVAGATLDRRESGRAYDTAHEIRREIGRRKLTPLPSRRIPRCEVCKHGTEKLFATSEATHDITGRNDEKICPNLCVRCWSRLHKDSEESE